jgi:tetratricopeptide (TPR) repeat protein
MRMIFPLPPLLVAGATLGGLFAPFAVGGGPTDSIGIAAATERQPGADVAVCHGSASAGVTRVMLRLAQIRTEVPQAEMQAASPAAAFADTDPPLWEGLGGVTYRITTANELAQSYFNQGLRLTYAFNHSEAQRAFRKAQKLDPDCAMCFWGEALVLGPNINLPMQEDAVAPAFAAAEKARMLAPKATPREQALIAAVSTRYAKDAKADRVPLDAAYALAMEKVAAQFPDDNEIAVLYAESVMDLSPWNYWQPGGHAPNQQSGPIVPTLERVLARDPNHPGAMHYYIHAVEASDRPERAEPYADRLRGAIPGAGHLVHMPSHIYYRVGRYLDALADNKTAIGVDEKYLASTNAPMGVYRLGYYPHNVHFVLASAQMAGDGPTVIAAAEKLRGLIPDEVARGIALVQPVKAAPYFAHALFSPSATVLALPDPGDAIPYVKAMWHYARGIAAGRVYRRRGGGECDRGPRGRGFHVAQILGRSGTGRAGAGPHCHRSPRRAASGRQGCSDRAVRAGGCAAGRAALHGAALLVLPGAAVARSRADAGGPTRRSRGAVPARAQARPRQRLVVVRACRTL